MKAPKRTPWSSRSELEELYEMLFAPDADVHSRRRGLARMSIYISSPSCPTFIHLLHSLVSVELLPYPPKGVEESQRSRMMIGMAIVRFINGLVDPLQNGPYARPISHLASSLSIPPSLIALRHRATHEDLPPLALLHQSLLSCISYLHYYSFLPLLSSSSTSASLPPGVLERMKEDERRVEGLIRRWKKVIKFRLREKEVREQDQSALELNKIKGSLQNHHLGLIVNVLIGEVGLVPSSVQKRAPLTSTIPTTPSLKIWLPLLQHLQQTSHSDLPSQLSSRILDILLNPESQSQIQVNGYSGHGSAEDVNTKEKLNDQRSFRWNLAIWLIWLWKNEEEGEETLRLMEEEKMEVLKKVLASMLELHDDEVVRRLFKVLSADGNHSNINGMDGFLPEIEMEEEDEGLKGLEIGMDLDNDNPSVDDANLERMEERLKEFETIIEKRRRTAASTVTRPDVNISMTDKDSATPLSTLPAGWRKLSYEEWKPCPIGLSGIP
ncbi:hypothetical protein I203_106474 [Kwoniella mangroviensis CBS 8507]|uniref:uncharacterized protein n=1 Tax=Kwoniella mangroviensis CBS 8507 TaxID=1296122 RepID=UPI00080D555E|nr:uncharacterized protein I203_07750 [Kwoniella mangroviensis CBS 8507]OCF63325.1 hypothetical protein I203_07750 [Kwoniella mangroviensis CBS 8507]